jgi:hypothetical protein
MSDVFNLWLAKVDESNSGNIAQTLLTGPLRSVVLNELKSTSRGGGKNSDELVVVDFRRWGSLLSADSDMCTYV